MPSAEIECGDCAQFDRMDAENRTPERQIIDQSRASDIRVMRGMHAQVCRNPRGGGANVRRGA